MGSTYTSTGNYGAASPSMKFDATGDQIMTPSLGTSVATQMSFWIKSQSAVGSFLGGRI
jgi:hypothetical protein